MPLLISPIDNTPMLHLNRYGIEIDVCTKSGGVWLDKGEFEKLVALIREAAALADHPDHRLALDRHDDDGYFFNRQGGRRK